ncbi:RNA recognition motif domain [Dillenia turbinata]|uniref:RNA recognition motif domain n=1 Tax=Dillenia turbinata TaxID=194707 RepID=A0AAN8VVM8_9MAGN
MASTEQPPKKRKFYDPNLSEPSPHQPQPQTLTESLSTKPLSQEELLRKQRNRDEIRRVVQRIVAEFIPRYAPYCPTALEAAAKVVINIHNWSLALVKKDEDYDGVSFQTAAACIFGLADICCTASLEAPTSSVIQGICAAVFLNVLTFFISSLEGKDIFQIVGKEILERDDFSKYFSELKDRVAKEDESAISKLFKFRALGLLRIFFCCPKDLLAACLELLNSPATEEVHKEGYYFLRQVTTSLHDDGADNQMDMICDAFGSCRDSLEITSEGSMVSNKEGSNNRNMPSNASPVTRSCLLSMVISRHPSLRRWLLRRYIKFNKLVPPQVASEVTSLLGEIVESLTETTKIENEDGDSDGDNSEPSIHINRNYVVSRLSNQHETLSEISGTDSTSRVHNSSIDDHDMVEKSSGTYRKSHTSVVAHEKDLNMFPSSNHETGGTRSADIVPAEQGDVLHGVSSMPNKQLPLPLVINSPSFRNDTYEGRNSSVQFEKNNVTRTEIGLPVMRTSSGGINNALASPKHQQVILNTSTANQVIWCSDGDATAMNIFSASKLLWVGSLGPDASEAQVRFQFERFGPIEQYFYFPIKGFALVEYRNIMDAVKAREFMRGHAPWGACLHIKFIDVGLGTRGAVNGYAVGSSCHVYVGNVSSQWSKDEILYELRKVVYKPPRSVIDITSDGALLIEFETPEEATTVMIHLRRHRGESVNHLTSLNAVPGSMARPHMDGSMPLRPSLRIDVRSNDSKQFSGNLVGSPHPQSLLESPAEKSHGGRHHSTPFAIKPEGNNLEFMSPRMNPENHGTIAQVGQASQYKRTVGMPETTARMDTYDNNMVVDSSQGGTKIVPGASEQIWKYQKPANELYSAPGSFSGLPSATQGPPIAPQQQMQPSPYVQPVYLPPRNSWDAHGFNQLLPVNQISPGVITSTPQGTTGAVPFLPASVTPLAQVQGSSLQPTGPLPVLSPPVSSLPPPLPDMPPPLPPSPPPLPQSLPPFVPPPPSSPPPVPPVVESSNLDSSRQTLQYQWQGALCKSGVHYCSIYAHRADSDICKYSNSISEPAEWPIKLDMTKRTDFRHVKSTFSSTPPNRFQDFVSYLKQRDCAGVIKIQAGKSLWARLLFILPYSSEACSLLSIAPNPLDCLIALVLPKETSLEWM